MTRREQITNYCSKQTFKVCLELSKYMNDDEVNAAGDEVASRFGPLIKHLAEKLDELERVLEFYSNEKNYLETSCEITSIDIKSKTVTIGNAIEYGAPAVLDSGKRARQALTPSPLDELLREGE